MGHYLLLPPVTSWDILWLITILVVGSIIAGAVDTWWHQRKQEQRRRERVG